MDHFTLRGGQTVIAVIAGVLRRKGARRPIAFGPHSHFAEQRHAQQRGQREPCQARLPVRQHNERRQQRTER